MQDELFDAAVCNAKQCIESTVNIPVAIRHQFILCVRCRCKHRHYHVVFSAGKATWWLLVRRTTTNQ